MRFKQKCKELRKRVLEIEENNEIATIALSRTQATIRRLRLEYAILLERLEDRATQLPDGIVAFEEMACPPTPTILDDSLVKSKTGNKKSKSSSSSSSSSSTTSSSAMKIALASGSSKSSNGPSDVASTTMGKQKARDPDLPKRPTNAYLIFCEMEKERIKQDDPNASDLSKSMTEAWKNLSEERRRPYYKLYEDDRIRYQREMAEYNQKKGGGGGSSGGGEPDLKKQKLAPQPEQEEADDDEANETRNSPIVKQTTETASSNENKQTTNVIKSEENGAIAAEENNSLENVNPSNETTES